MRSTWLIELYRTRNTDHPKTCQWREAARLFDVQTYVHSVRTVECRYVNLNRHGSRREADVQELDIHIHFARSSERPASSDDYEVEMRKNLTFMSVHVLPSSMRKKYPRREGQRRRQRTSKREIYGLLSHQHNIPDNITHFPAINRQPCPMWGKDCPFPSSKHEWYLLTTLQHPRNIVFCVLAFGFGSLAAWHNRLYHYLRQRTQSTLWWAEDSGLFKL